MQISIFYHICTVGPWREIVLEQMGQIVDSGLYEAATKLDCYILGVEVGACQELLQQYGEKVVIEKTNAVDKLDEYFCIEDIANHVDSATRILYLHSKGVTRFGSKTYRLGEREIVVENLYSNVTDWRNLMEYVLIQHWQACVRELEQHDAVGINYVRWPSKTWGHFSGNFWWCKGDYFLTLTERVWSPEAHVGRNNPRVKELFNSGLAGHGHYLHPFPKEKYVGKLNFV
jgi:hypothetical protein